MTPLTFIKVGRNRNVRYINLAHVVRIDVVYPGMGAGGSGITPGTSHAYMSDGTEVRLSREEYEEALNAMGQQVPQELRNMVWENVQ